MTVNQPMTLILWEPIGKRLTATAKAMYTHTFFPIWLSSCESHGRASGQPDHTDLRNSYHIRPICVVIVHISSCYTQPRAYDATKRPPRRRDHQNQRRSGRIERFASLHSRRVNPPWRQEMKLQMGQGQARRKALGASIRAGRQAGVNFSILRFA